MYLSHYSIRALISPLILAPPRAPQHLIVTLAAIVFNLMNGYMVGSFLGSADPVREGWEKEGWFWVLVVGWAGGLLGNGQSRVFSIWSLLCSIVVFIETRRTPLLTWSIRLDFDHDIQCTTTRSFIHSAAPRSYSPYSPSFVHPNQPTQWGARKKNEGQSKNEARFI
jgi:hypothetical protein